MAGRTPDGTRHPPLLRRSGRLSPGRCAAPVRPRPLGRPLHALPDLQRTAPRPPERGAPRPAPARNPAPLRRLPHLSVLPTGLLVGAALPTASRDRRGGPA